MRLSIENYNNFGLFVKALQRPQNVLMTNKTSENTDDYKCKKFYYTNSYDEAVNLLKNGYKEPLDKIKSELKNFCVTNRRENKRSIVNDVFGFVPHVPNAILGIPNSMINYKFEQRNIKVIKIVYDMSIVYDEKPETIVKNSINLLKLLIMLENMGFKTELFLTSISNDDRKQLFVAPFIKLKEYKTPLNIAKLCFPLVHPSMLRRIIFKWKETTPTITNSDFNYGYGIVSYKSIGEQKLKELLIKNNKLKNSDIYINYYDLYSEDKIKKIAESYK